MLLLCPKVCRIDQLGYVLGFIFSFQDIEDMSTISLGETLRHRSQVLDFRLIKEPLKRSNLSNQLVLKGMDFSLITMPLVGNRCN